MRKQALKQYKVARKMIRAVAANQLRDYVLESSYDHQTRKAALSRLLEHVFQKGYLRGLKVATGFDTPHPDHLAQMKICGSRTGRFSSAKPNVIEIAKRPTTKGQL